MSFSAVVLLGTVAYTVAQMAAGAMFSLPLPPPPDSALPWMLLANLLVVACLAGFARLSDWPAPRLALALWAVAFLMGHLNNLIEGAFFDLFPARTLLTLLPMMAIPPAAAAATVAYARRHPARAAHATPLPSFGDLALRLLAVGVVYTVFYFAFGTIIFPYVRTFYATRVMPALGPLLAMQILARGPLFGLAVLLVVRMDPGSRRLHALLGGLALSVLGGVAPLIVPNSILPDAVRWVHFCETVSENFFVGAFAGWLLSPSRAILAAPARRAGAREEIAHGEAR